MLLLLLLLTASRYFIREGTRQLYEIVMTGDERSSIGGPWGITLVIF